MKLDIDRRALIFVCITLTLFLLFAIVVVVKAASLTTPVSAAPANAYDTYAAYTVNATPSGGTRADLRRILGVPDCPTGAERISSTSENDLQRVVFDVCGFTLSGLFSPGERGFVLVLHGTASSAAAAWADVDYMHGIARALNAAGYAVFAPDILTRADGDVNAERNALDKRLRPFGVSLVGVELMAFTAVLDWYGGGAVYGISLGGYLAFHACALSDAVTACGVSGYIEDRAGKLAGDSDYPESYWNIPNSDYMTADGYLTRFDDVQVARLIGAPLYVETGSNDPRAAVVSGVIERMRAAGVQVDSVIGDGGHETYREAFMEFLARRQS